MRKNLDFMKQMVNWQADEVSKSFTALGHAYKEYYAYMAMFVNDELYTELWFNEGTLKKLKEAEKNTEHQIYILRRLIDEYKEAKALEERRADYTVFTVNIPKGVETPLKGDGTVFYQRTQMKGE